MLSPWVILTVFPLLLGLVFFEIYYYRKKNLEFPYREAGVSFLTFIIFQIVNKIQSGQFVWINQMFYDWRPFTFDMQSFWHWILLFFVIEFFYYWQHRAAHSISWLWASHSVHHSPTTITFSGAYRLSITTALSFVFVFYLPVHLLGFPAQAVALVYTLDLIYQFWLHTEIIPKLGWFEKVFNTPSHHRVHHAVNPIYLDKNHGGVLIIFDKLFGTFQEELENEPCRYGLVGKPATFNVFKIFFQEWVTIARHSLQIRSAWEFFLCVAGAPGAFSRWKTAQKELAITPASPETERKRA